MEKSLCFWIKKVCVRVFFGLSFFGLEKVMWVEVNFPRNNLEVKRLQKYFCKKTTFRHILITEGKDKKEFVFGLVEKKVDRLWNLKNSISKFLLLEKDVQYSGSEVNVREVEPGEVEKWMSKANELEEKGARVILRQHEVNPVVMEEKEVEMREIDIELKQNLNMNVDVDFKVKVKVEEVRIRYYPIAKVPYLLKSIVEEKGWNELEEAQGFGLGVRECVKSGYNVVQWGRHWSDIMFVYKSLREIEKERVLSLS